MANLFVVYTPFQFFIAQQIVEQEKLKDCVLLMSYIPHNRNFINIYEIMEIEGMWSKKIIFENFDRWDGNKLSNLKDISFAYKNYKRIKKILEENNVDNIFLGEIQNPALRFTDIVFSHLGYHVNFYEEGAAHYIQRPYIKETLLLKTKIFLLDLLYYLPLYHVRFAKWHYIWFRPIKNDLPIHKRFSVIPIYKESFDVQLFPRILISERTLNYIQRDVNKDDKLRILYMTDPLAELIGDKWLHVYYKTIEESFNQLNRNATLYIKFHPRDSQKDKNIILNLANQAGIKFKILSETINIPVEYYLQKYKFDSIYIFNASTYFYNGFLFPQAKFIKLLPLLYNNLKKQSKGEAFISLEKILKHMETQII